MTPSADRWFAAFCKVPWNRDRRSAAYMDHPRLRICTVDQHLIDANGAMRDSSDVHTRSSATFTAFPFRDPPTREN
jgi:hypothetical protein